MHARSITRRRVVLDFGQAAAVTCLGARAIEAVEGAQRAGVMRHIGEQRAIFTTGQARARLSLRELAGLSHLYAIGPVAGLDGEITVVNSDPHVSKVRGPGDGYVVDRTFDHGAIFLVWAQVREWEVIGVPQPVASYRELETVVKEIARQRGVDTEVPFPFLISGAPHELVWHINVDRTDGKPITRDLFSRSKQRYTLRGERVDIFGVYSEKHGGIFMPLDAAIHIHFISHTSPATGHIDAIVPGSFDLRLPRD